MLLYNEVQLHNDIKLDLSLCRHVFSNILSTSLTLKSQRFLDSENLQVGSIVFVECKESTNSRVMRTKTCGKNETKAKSDDLMTVYVDKTMLVIGVGRNIYEDKW